MVLVCLVVSRSEQNQPNKDHSFYCLWDYCYDCCYIYQIGLTPVISCWIFINELMPKRRQNCAKKKYTLKYTRRKCNNNHKITIFVISFYCASIVIRKNSCRKVVEELILIWFGGGGWRLWPRGHGDIFCPCQNDHVWQWWQGLETFHYSWKRHATPIVSTFLAWKTQTAIKRYVKNLFSFIKFRLSNEWYYTNWGYFFHRQLRVRRPQKPIISWNAPTNKDCPK